jgi:hypothetical protein
MRFDALRGGLRRGGAFIFRVHIGQLEPQRPPDHPMSTYSVSKIPDLTPMPPLFVRSSLIGCW